MVTYDLTLRTFWSDMIMSRVSIYQCRLWSADLYGARASFRCKSKVTHKYISSTNTTGSINNLTRRNAMRTNNIQETEHYRGVGKRTVQ